jgi:hypothetical protein
MSAEVGRMLFVVFVDDAPIAAENFKQLFSGELVSCFLMLLVHFAAMAPSWGYEWCTIPIQGYVPKDGKNREGEGMPYHLKVCTTSK